MLHQVQPVSAKSQKLNFYKMDQTFPQCPWLNELFLFSSYIRKATGVEKGDAESTFFAISTKILRTRVQQGRTQGRGGLPPLSLISYENFMTCAKET